MDALKSTVYVGTARSETTSIQRSRAAAYSFRAQLRDANVNYGNMANELKTRVKDAKSVLQGPDMLKGIALTDILSTKPIDYAEIHYQLATRHGTLEGVKIHEIGCGIGAGLYAFKNLGAIVSGSEPGAQGTIARQSGVQMTMEPGDKAMRKLRGKPVIISRDVLDTLHADATTFKTLIGAAREKTDLQIHEVDSTHMHPIKDYLHPEWKTTFLDLGIKTIIIMERLKRVRKKR